MIRLPIQVVAALSMMYFAQIGIESIGNITGSGVVIFSTGFSIVFTIMCTVGVINSINMIDGVDGLSGTIIFLTLMPLNYFCWVAGDINSVALLTCFQSAILAFLYFNARVFRKVAIIFLGDAGSMFFGLILVWYLIKLTQGENAVLSPVAAGWVFGLPLADTISVMVGRILAKRSPFDADRSHLHHKLLDAGLSVNQTLMSMAFLHLIFMSIGIIGNISSASETLLFWVFTIIVVFHYFLMDRYLAYLTKAKKSAEVGV